ncbi:manganese efflux pump MntP family protein [Halomonas elongata]|uniref:Putative manganese efflux pump MntP n=1 Tax=Halomonas elongata (strain ATCC 33173 / DSM 2581 / NBRC 15536 / NCIMB 2198 / 1H9) TaxID=768066 RepID=E1VC18_HALED|nr:manganese efflux pump MntP family protein [Halomonas elongata]MBW5799014.1 manganese efflux pump MntP family protein [Halomonas elongata]MDL4864515.1 manganese efflux pump MntP family protein [Halomonas elongata]WBF19571.1 manganese efflux pump MntP family protein [Halomonas elongata]WPU48435.1 manganese efflux pump MntP family protein [Halomonas elongata DSM 2581]WVI73001.1 manganese efflux pump MntP family protein [Halomonas elongata]
MSLFSTIFLAFSMSSDAFVASLSKGAALPARPSLRQALRTGLVFGIIETLTPLLGWTLGLSMAQYVAAWDHWIAFGLLSLLGAHMIHEGLQNEEADATPRRSAPSFLRLVMTALATSIDALVIGITLAFMDANILWTSLAIGTATLLMTTLGVMLGRVINTMIGKRAEILGGLALCGIGVAILVDHLGLLA